MLQSIFPTESNVPILYWVKSSLSSFEVVVVVVDGSFHLDDRPCTEEVPLETIMYWHGLTLRVSTSISMSEVHIGGSL